MALGRYNYEFKVGCRLQTLLQAHNQLWIALIECPIYNDFAFLGSKFSAIQFLQIGWTAYINRLTSYNYLYSLAHYILCLFTFGVVQCYVYAKLLVCADFWLHAHHTHFDLHTCFCVRPHTPARTFEIINILCKRTCGSKKVFHARLSRTRTHPYTPACTFLKIFVHPFAQKSPHPHTCAHENVRSHQQFAHTHILQSKTKEHCPCMCHV